MKAVAYSIKPFEKELLIKANGKKHDITLISNRLSLETVSYARGKEAVLVFSSDDLSAPVIRQLKEAGVKYIATRSAGTDHIDFAEAQKLGIKVSSVPAYSPESIGEHAVTLMLALSRNILATHRQTMEFNFTLDNFVATTLRNKTIGIVGFGKTGRALAGILRGFGSRILVNDIIEIKKSVLSGADQVSYDQLLAESDIISFHVPLTDQTRHMVNAETIARMKDGVTLINVSRGAVFNSTDVYDALQNEKIGRLGMDVYEFEHNVFFFDYSKKPMKDQLLKSFIQHSRVLLTPHQAFLTKEALQIIAEKTIANLDEWAAEKKAQAALQPPPTPPLSIPA